MRSVWKTTLVVLVGLALAGCLLVGCGGAPAAPAVTPLAEETPLATRRPPLEECVLAPVAVPTHPAVIPRYAQLDETTGLHVTGTAPDEIDLADWRLVVDGKVPEPLSFTYDQLRCLSRVEATPTLVCPGFFEDVATWAGVPLREVLELAGVPEAGVRLRLHGADGYTQILDVEMAMGRSPFLAYEWEGEPLPYIHGFPIRAVLPGVSGNQWVKWIYRIEVF